MKRFFIHLKEGRIALVEVTGITGGYEEVGGTFDVDFVVRDEQQNEKVRVERQNILYVTISEEPVNS